jgi:signal transduction histidine kinase
MTAPANLIAPSRQPAGRAVRATRSIASDVRAVRDRVLHIPLSAKLFGANLIVVAAALLALDPPTRLRLEAIVLVGIAIAVGFALNLLLVRRALAPIDALQGVAERVARGEWYTRATTSPVADARIDQLVATFNHLLDTVTEDRNHISALIRRTLRARELERASLSGQLRETVAQRIAAISLQLAAAEHAPEDARRTAALHAARELSLHILDEVGQMADAVYPGLLQELGLPAALAALAVRAGRRGRVVPSFTSSGVGTRLAPALVTAMYFVAEEAIHNAESHANAGMIRMTLRKDADVLRLEVVDDGRGFDVHAATEHGRGVGLFEARELLASVHGQMELHSAPGRGTRLIATARLDQGDSC